MRDREDVVPWKRKEDFMWVADQLRSVDFLHSDPPTQLLPVLYELNTWCIRMERNRLPRSIVSTRDLLLRRLLHHAGLPLGVMRCVNSICDEMQQHHNYSRNRPLHVVASDLELPTWLIELRHEICHGILPSFNSRIYLIAFSALMNYLISSYWQPRLDCYSIAKGNNCADHMTHSLTAFTQSVPACLDDVLERTVQDCRKKLNPELIRRLALKLHDELSDASDFDFSNSLQKWGATLAILKGTLHLFTFFLHFLKSCEFSCETHFVQRFIPWLDALIGLCLPSTADEQPLKHAFFKHSDLSYLSHHRHMILQICDLLIFGPAFHPSAESILLKFFDLLLSLSPLSSDTSIRFRELIKDLRSGANSNGTTSESVLERLSTNAWLLLPGIDWWNYGIGDGPPGRYESYARL